MTSAAGVPLILLGLFFFYRFAQSFRRAHVSNVDRSLGLRVVLVLGAFSMIFLGLSLTLGRDSFGALGLTLTILMFGWMTLTALVSVLAPALGTRLLGEPARRARKVGAYLLACFAVTAVVIWFVLRWPDLWLIPWLLMVATGLLFTILAVQRVVNGQRSIARRRDE